MSYKKESILLVVLGAVLLVLVSTSAEADYCDYCDDFDSAMYNGSYYDTPYDTPYDQYEYESLGFVPYEEPQVEASSETSSYSYEPEPYEPDPNVYDTYEYYTYESEPNEPDPNVYDTYVYDTYSSLGSDDQASLYEEAPTTELTNGFDSPIVLVGYSDYTQTGPGADYGQYYIPPDNTYSSTNSILFDQPILSLEQLKAYNAEFNAPVPPSSTGYSNQDFGDFYQPSYTGIYPSQTSSMTYMAPYSSSDPSKQYVMYGYPSSDYYFSPNTLLDSQTPSSSSLPPSYYAGMMQTGPTSVNFADYVDPISLALGYNSNSISITAPNGVTSISYGGYGANLGYVDTSGGSTPTGSSYSYDPSDYYLANGLPNTSFPSPPVEIVYGNKGPENVRDQNISSRLAANFAAAAKVAGVDRIMISSGGQPPTGNYREDCIQNSAGTIDRCGSTRHDNGYAADIMLVKNGRTLNFTNLEDQKVFAAFITESVRLGATGVGAGVGYMGGFTIHVGYGTPAVWGANGESENAPTWVKTAFNAGLDNVATASIAPVTVFPTTITTTAIPIPRLRPTDEAGLPTTDGTTYPSYYYQATAPSSVTVQPGPLAYYYGYGTLDSSAFITPTSPSYGSYYYLPPTTASQTQTETSGGIPLPNLRPYGTPTTVPLPNLRPGEESPTYIAYGTPYTGPLPNLRPSETISYTTYGTPSTVPLPNLRPDIYPTPYPLNTGSVTTPTTVVRTESTTIPAGPYGAEVLAKAILTGDADKIAAAQKVVEANAQAELIGACGGNIFCIGGLALRADAEKAKATAVVENYLTQTLPTQAPGAVRDFQQKVESNPSLIAGLTPEQHVLLEKAFSALPPAPIAVTTVVTQTSQYQPLPTYYAGITGPTGPTQISIADYINYSMVTPEFYGTTDRLYNLPTAPLPTSPLVSKDFTVEDVASVKDLYVFNPSANAYYYGYLTLDSSAFITPTESPTRASQYYYYIPSTTGGEEPQQVTTSIPPYYISINGPQNPTSVRFEDYLNTNVAPEYYETLDRIVTGSTNTWGSNFLFTYQRPPVPVPESPTPTVTYSEDSGSGYQPVLSWRWFYGSSAPSSGSFNVNYSLDDSFGNSSGSGITPSEGVLGGLPPELAVCSNTETPSATGCSFNIVPSLLRKDTMAKLYWNISGLQASDSCSLTSLPSTPGLPTWNGAGSSWVNSSGHSVIISQKTIFTLTCKTSGGSTASVSKTVNIAPVIQEI